MHAPMYEGLAVMNLLGFMRQYDQVWNFVPDESHELENLGREYLFSLAYTVIGDPVADFVRNAVETRNQKLITDRNLAINMAPRFAEAFNNSSHISTVAGRGAAMLTAQSRRRKTKAQLQAEKRSAEE